MLLNQGLFNRKLLLSEGLTFLVKVYHLFPPLDKARYCLFALLLSYTSVTCFGLASLLLLAFMC